MRSVTASKYRWAVTPSLTLRIYWVRWIVASLGGVTVVLKTLDLCPKIIRSSTIPAHAPYNQLKHCEHPRPARVGRARRIRAAGRARGLALESSSSFQMLQIECHWTSKSFESDWTFTQFGYTKLFASNSAVWSEKSAQIPLY